MQDLTTCMFAGFLDPGFSVQRRHWGYQIHGARVLSVAVVRTLVCSISGDRSVRIGGKPCYTRHAKKLPRDAFCACSPPPPPVNRSPSSDHQTVPLQDGALAQLGERLHGMQEVSGSIPLGSTIPHLTAEISPNILNGKAIFAVRSPVSRE